MEENDAFDILNDISVYVTLVQLMDSLRKVNHALFSTQESLDQICSPSVGEEQFATF